MKRPVLLSIALLLAGSAVAQDAHVALDQSAEAMDTWLDEAYAKSMW